MEVPTIFIKDLLEADSRVDLTYKEDLLIGRKPSDPDNIVVLFDTPAGGSQLTTQKNSESSGRQESAGLQIQVRNNKYDKAMQQANDLVDVLHARGNEIINNTKIGVIEALDNPSLLHWDDNNRAVIVTNFLIQHQMAN